MAKTKPEIIQHILVPKHEKMSVKETEAILSEYKITLAQLPRIFAKDPAIAALNPVAGEVIRISRKSPTAGDIEYYRCVVNGQ